jgi:hypothetical protein
MLSVLSETSWVLYVTELLSINGYFANTFLDWSVLQCVVVDPTARGTAYPITFRHPYNVVRYLR